MASFKKPDAFHLLNNSKILVGEVKGTSCHLFTQMLPDNKTKAEKFLNESADYTQTMASNWFSEEKVAIVKKLHQGRTVVAVYAERRIARSPIVYSRYAAFALCNLFFLEPFGEAAFRVDTILRLVGSLFLLLTVSDQYPGFSSGPEDQIKSALASKLNQAYRFVEDQGKL